MRPAKRDRKLMFWVNQNEDEAIRASAEVNAVTVAEYIRCCAVGRPVKARNRLFRAQRQLERQRVQQEAKDRQMEQLEAAKRHAATENKKAEAERRRLYQAQALAAEAGGVAAWFQGMTAKDRLKWQDLEAELLAAEKLHKEAEAAWTRFTGKTAAAQSYETHTLAPPKPKVSQPEPRLAIPSTSQTASSDDWWQRNTGMSAEEWARKTKTRFVRTPDVIDIGPDRPEPSRSPGVGDRPAGFD
jgi:hypothetical protein